MKKFPDRLIALALCFTLTLGAFVYRPPEAKALVGVDDAVVIGALLSAFAGGCGLIFSNNGMSSNEIAQGLTAKWNDFKETLASVPADFPAWLGYDSMDALITDLRWDEVKDVLSVPRTVARKFADFTDWLTNSAGVKVGARPSYISGIGQDGGYFFSNFSTTFCEDVTSNFVISLDTSSFSFRNYGLDESDTSMHSAYFKTDFIPIERAGYYLVDYDYSLSWPLERYGGFGGADRLHGKSNYCWPRLFYDVTGNTSASGYSSIDLYTSSNRQNYTSTNIGSFFSGATGTSEEVFLPAGSVIFLRFGIYFCGKAMFDTATWHFTLRLSDNEYNAAASNGLALSTSAGVQTPDLADDGETAPTPTITGVGWDAATIEELLQQILDQLQTNTLATTISVDATQTGGETGTDTDEDTKPYLPFIPQIFDKVKEIPGTLSNIWDTVKGLPAAIAEKISAFFTTLWGWLQDIITEIKALPAAIAEKVGALFTPDQALVTEITDTFKGKFGFLSTLKQFGDDLFGMTADSEPPVIWVHLENAESKFGYTYGDKQKILDFTWYQKYKASVDGLLSGFLWLGYLWLLFKRAPGILNGMSMDGGLLPPLQTGGDVSDAPRIGSGDPSMHYGNGFTFRDKGGRRK